MSSLIDKVKAKAEAITERNSNKGDNPQSSNYGPHGSAVGNKFDPTVDSDLDNRNNPGSRVGGYGNTQVQHDQYGTTQGAGGFGSSDTYDSRPNNPGFDNPQSGNAGPHSSNLTNKLDPRVDSDRDNRNDPSSRVGGYGNTQQYNDNYGQAGGPGGLGSTNTGYGDSTGSGYGRTTDNAPLHSAGHTGHTGQTGHATHGGHAGGLAAASTTGTAGEGLGSNTYDDPRSSNAGPHSSNLMNKLDPRHDSDRDHRNDPTSRVGGYGAQDDSYGHAAGIGGTGPSGGYGGATGTTGDYATGAPTGPSGYGNSSYTPGSGDANRTAGPHNSNIMNKLDPRVDSDMDGSKTYGGNQTHR